MRTELNSSGKGIAVSLTTLPLDADSRTYRIARALSEAGFRSIVIEARASIRRFWDESIEVRSAGSARVGVAPNSVFSPGRLRNMVRMVREGRAGPLGAAVLYTGFRAFDWQEYCRRPRALIPPAELYVLHSFELYRVVAPIARRLGARILYDAHDFYRAIEPEERQAVFERNWRQPFLHRLEDRLAAEADMMTTVSNGVAELMMQAFGRRPEVIRNCHDERCDSKDARPLRQMLGLGETDRLAVVVGNYKAGLAVEVAAAALQRLPANWHLVFLGRGYEAAAARLSGGLVGTRVHFGYAVAPDEIVPTIRSADVGLVVYEPYSENYRYALPNGFFQLIAAGLPLVRGQLPEIESTIGKAMVGYFLPRLEPQGLAQAMLRCVEECDRLRANVADLARSLRWEIEAMRLRRLIGAVPLPTGGSPLAPVVPAG